jgi:hypothetical protein
LRRGREHEKAGPLAATVNVGAQPITPLMRTRLVFHWAGIAIEQEPLARAGRAEVVRTHAAGEAPFRLRDELRPAMIAVAACAHSLDALYAELAQLVGPETVAAWEDIRRHGRWSEVAGILDLALDVDVSEWRPRLETLFVRLRNPIVHPKAKAQAPTKHPALPTRVSPEHATYTVEAVEESVDLVLEILSACVDAPRSAVRAWADDSSPFVKLLHDRRAQLRP